MSYTLEYEPVARATHFTSFATRRRNTPVFAVGVTLCLLFAGSYIDSVTFETLLPTLAMNKVWIPLLLGVAWLSWPSFMLGLLETIAYGLYVTLIFGFGCFSAYNAKLV